MKLAHAVKVPLSLLFAPVYLAFSRLGPVALTQTLRFNDLGATADIAVPTLVLDIIMLTHCSVTLSTALSYSLDCCFMLHSRRRRDAVTCFSENNKNRQEALTGTACQKQCERCTKKGNEKSAEQENVTGWRTVDTTSYMK